MLFHQPGNSKGNLNCNARFYTGECWEPHFHKNLELIYVLEGRVCCTVNQHTHTLTAGEMGLCLPYDIHAYTPDRDSRYWVLVFSEDFVRYFARRIQGKTSGTFAFCCGNAVKQLLEEMLVYGEAPSVCTLKACLYGVCGEFLEKVPLQDNSGKRQTFLLVTDYLSKNYMRCITLEDIAGLLGYNYHYVSRFFRKAFQMSFSDLLSLYRLEAAAALLDETDKKITEIAFESGFQSIRSFNNSFRAQFGMSPSEYKKACRDRNRRPLQAE